MRKIPASMLRLLPWLPAALFLAACSSATKVTVQEDFASTDTFAHSFPGNDKATCEAARRALLSQGYVIQEANASTVRGRKNFQPGADVHVQIEFHVVCAPDSKGSNSTTAFANAVRDRYSLKKSSNSASLGVGGVGSLSLPFGSSDDSLVRVASETISNKQFYERFFALVERYFDDSALADDETGDMDE
ncbi:MAG TPA: DUF2242 domain-containing protein [Noviherbaspirillum sp.]|uniref:DUF2242 domain-containing protein n=1 Tax=Noviherbaspirillum sp. TaxID=1926288 RepID=UPI002D53F581|nr:DUF2242 domain-containing protein [Noviherbaspirillum sp.]HYD96961.1 DUF2242 domain-containing protein [Noviherbaspirillum sp.]